METSTLKAAVEMEPGKVLKVPLTHIWPEKTYGYTEFKRGFLWTKLCLAKFIRGVPTPNVISLELGLSGSN